jgi:hypothetical protein
VAFYVTHNDGSMTSDPPLSILPNLLDELADASADDPDVSMSDEDGFTLSVFPSGRVVFENVETVNNPRHIDGLSMTAVLALLTALAERRLDEVMSLEWQEGYGDVD